MLLKQLSKRCLLASAAVTLILLLSPIFFLEHPPLPTKGFLSYDPQLFSLIEESLFEGFDNNTGTLNGSNIVPNYVHFIFFEYTNITYTTAVCVLAAFKNQRPEKIFFHTNAEEFTGPHWIKIRDTLGPVLEIRHIEMPTHIFGQTLRREWLPSHAADVTKIRVLMQYGGIFLDNDCYVVRSLDVFRRYEMTIGITNRNYIGTQVLIAHKDARFLKLWLESYRIYHPEECYMNAGEKPLREILAYRPELVHSVRTVLGVHGLGERLYSWDKWESWRKYYSIHLVLSYRSCPVPSGDYQQWLTIDETNVCHYEKPFGEMAREIYSDFC